MFTLEMAEESYFLSVSSSSTSNYSHLEFPVMTVRMSYPEFPVMTVRTPHPEFPIKTVHTSHLEFPTMIVRTLHPEFPVMTVRMSCPEFPVMTVRTPYPELPIMTENSLVDMVTRRSDLSFLAQEFLIDKYRLVILFSKLNEIFVERSSTCFFGVMKMKVSRVT